MYIWIVCIIVLIMTIISLYMYEGDHLVYNIRCLFNPSISYSGLPTPSYMIERIKTVIQDIPPQSYTLIDFGCGEGKMIQHLSPLVYHTIGIELDTTLASRATQIFQDNPSITILHMNITEYQFANIPTILYMYEPLWNVNYTEALEVYKKVFTTISRISSPCYIIYLSGINAKLTESDFKLYPFTLLHHSYFRRGLGWKGNQLYVWKCN